MDTEITLPKFPPACELLRNEKCVMETMRSPGVTEINHYVLGPEGTNISQAALRWSEERGMGDKSNLRYCDSPEEAIEKASDEAVRNSVNLAWTCAVYYNEHRLFFNCVDHNLFFAQQRMLLDCMQLVSRQKIDISSVVSVATHPSPGALLDAYSNSFSFIHAKSNSHAAQLCRAGIVDAAITTETARRLNKLVKIHEFGSPEMVFFACLPKSSSNHLKELMR